jgi:hypothetical protein
MTAGPSTNSTECNREKLVNALRDEALIKQLEAAIYSNEISQKALDVVCKRIASGEVSDNMLLHVALSLRVCPKTSGGITKFSDEAD